MKWEYLYISTAMKEDTSINNYLNDNGANGWELVTFHLKDGILHHPQFRLGLLILIFKRPIQ